MAISPVPPLESQHADRMAPPGTPWTPPLNTCRHRSSGDTPPKFQTFKVPSRPALRSAMSSPSPAVSRHWTSATGLPCANRACASRGQLAPDTAASAEAGRRSRRTARCPFCVPHSTRQWWSGAGEDHTDMAATPPSRPSAGSAVMHCSPSLPSGHCLNTCKLFTSKPSPRGLCIAETTSRSPPASSGSTHVPMPEGTGSTPDTGSSRRRADCGPRPLVKTIGVTRIWCPALSDTKYEPFRASFASGLTPFSSGLCFLPRPLCPVDPAASLES
mmetsp:Transcript_70796/g.200564  ORF Transcript_70796/g.200564 Transcript_70796/m.200564 type:complete len:273 (-) Transcript_70796:595-1413(-)